MAVKVTDHALVRFMERAGRYDVEALRHSLEASLARASEVAEALKIERFQIIADGLEYCVRDGKVVTVKYHNPVRRPVEKRAP